MDVVVAIVVAIAVAVARVVTREVAVARVTVSADAEQANIWGGDRVFVHYVADPCFLCVSARIVGWKHFTIIA